MFVDIHNIFPARNQLLRFLLLLRFPHIECREASYHTHTICGLGSWNSMINAINPLWLRLRRSFANIKRRIVR